MMKTMQDEPGFHASGFFVLRTPLLPFSAFSSDASLSLELAESRLARVLEDPDVQSALRLASPDLMMASDAKRAGFAKPERQRALLHALQRYVARMSGRATPFGLFAGVSTGTFSDRTRLHLPERDKWVRRSHIDMGFLAQIIEQYLRRDEVRSAIRFRPNQDLYRIDRQWRYAESFNENTGRTYRLVSLKDSPHLSAVLESARQGGTRTTLARRATRVLPGVSRRQVEEFIDELIEAQVLVPDINVLVTGADATKRLIEQLESTAVTAPLSRALTIVREALDESDRRPWGMLREPAAGIVEVLQEFGAPPRPAEVVQVDLFKPAELSLGKKVLGAIAEGIRVLHRFGPAGAARTPQLHEFRREFIERYGDSEIPLSEALDDDSGIGFPVGSHRLRDESPLLAGLGIGRRSRDETIQWGVREAVLSGKLGEALAQQAQEVRIADEDLRQIQIEAPPLPDSFAAFGTVAAASADAIDRGDFQVLLRSVIGPSGVTFLGRFCYGDEQLERWVREHIADEESMKPEAIFAEIVHVPRGRLGNFLRRPILRRYELPYLGDAAVLPADRITVDDLLVSVRDDRIVLLSQSRGREVLPRLTSAHHYNVDREMPIYRFLASLQSQGTASRLGWDWGPMKYTVPYLPRVVAGRCVLMRRCWNLRAGELEPLRRTKDASALRDIVQRIRKQRDLPRYIVVEERDNELPIDFENPLSVEGFAELMKKGPEGPVYELFPGPDQLCVTGEDGRFVHEMFVPFSLDKAPAAREGEIRLSSPRKVSRATMHRPGSEWLYLKLYTGTATADQLLIELVAPLIKWAKNAQLLNRWFFLRYDDPDHHIRLRIRGDISGLYGALRERLRRDLSSDRFKTAVWREQWDTYVAETGRYGGPEGLAISEELFQIDSETVLALLPVASSDVRWIFAYAGVDRLLAALGMSHEERLACVEGLREGFFREFALEASDRQRLGARFREHRPLLMSLLEWPVKWPEPFRRKAAIFERNGERIRVCSEQLRDLSRRGHLSEPFRDLAASFIHLHVNRMLRSGQREHETVLYHFLAQSYRSLLAIRSSTESKTGPEQEPTA